MKAGPARAGGTGVRRTLDYFEVVGHRGSLRTAGVGQRIAGNACDVGIVDDPFGSREDAESPTVRNRSGGGTRATFIRGCGRRPGAGDAHALAPRRRAGPAAAEHARPRRPTSGPYWPFRPSRWSRRVRPNPARHPKPGDVLWPEFKSLADLRKIEAQDRRMFAALYQLNPAEVGGTEWAPNTWAGRLVPEGRAVRKAHPPGRYNSRFPAVGVDPVQGREDQQGDYCGIVFLGRRHGMFYVDANLEPRNSRDVVRAVRQFADSAGPTPSASRAISSRSCSPADAGRCARHAATLDDPGDAHRRGAEAGPHPQLSPYITDRRLSSALTPGCRLLVDQLMDFPAAEHDDGPDALEQAFRVLYYLLGITA